MKKDFRTSTRDTLIACGKWFEDNADKLADVIADGCCSWDIDFCWDSYEDNMPPKINVSIEKVSRDIINAYFDLD